MAAPDFRPLNAVEARVQVEAGRDGVLILKDPREMAPAERTIIAYLRRWANETPDRVMLAERGPAGDWVRSSYAQMRHSADAIAQALLDRGILPGQSVLILSGNSIEHAALMLGAMTAGITTVPLSPAYSLASTSFSKLDQVLEAVHPALIFVQDAKLFAPALAALGHSDIPVVAVTGIHAGSTFIPFARLLETRSTSAVEMAYAATGPDTVAKILFTSGSTGRPKGVITTQRMLCLNMAMMDSIWHSDEHTKPYVTLNWMPWNHTMAGSGLFNRSLRQGGSYYIDAGRPMPGHFDQTLANLREVSPHSYSDVPAGFAMLAAALEEDDELRRRFFQNLVFLQYAGASLPSEVWAHLQRLSVRSTGRRIPFITGYGCTEAGPSITQLYWIVEGSGYIGLPLPGVEVKLIPVDHTRYEIRARGGNISPGYIAAPELSVQAFDAEGFYITGDSVTFVDPREPTQGLRFASRVAEDFKLLTGTFVTVGVLRSQLQGALLPLLRDVVITGSDRAYVGVLGWPDITACRALLGEGQENLGDEDVLAAPAVFVAIQTALRVHNASSNASSTRVERMVLLQEPPSSEAHEITEKGYINQRRVLERRAADVDRLYLDPPQAGVIVMAR
jgi:feruloyl-CoA synthase